MCALKEILNTHPYRNNRSFAKGEEILLTDCIALVHSGVVEVSCWPENGELITLNLASTNELLNLSQHPGYIFTAVIDCRLNILPLNRFQDCDAARVDRLIEENHALIQTRLVLNRGTAVDGVKWALGVLYKKGLRTSKTTESRHDLKWGLTAILARMVGIHTDSASRALTQIRRLNGKSL
jgi:hypothetical protein